MVAAATRAVIDEGAPEEVLDGSLHARPGVAPGQLRKHTARGVLINSAFQVGFAVINLLQRFAVAAFLTVTEFGVWGLVLTAILTLSSLKQIGIADKYVQQDEADQELAFQKAFTLELFYTIGFCALLGIILPLYALAYDRPEVLLPSLVLSLALLGAALASPIWIFFRRMQFVRQRLLDGINPVVSTAVMVPLAAAGAGYWSLVIGVVVGSFASAAAALASCPYKLALRFDRGTLRDYVGFSWPLLVGSGSGLLVIQGSLLTANYTVGLVGVGAITLASSLLVFAQRVDGIISATIYPAVCAVKDRTDLMMETFVKSNRLALMWGLPFGIGMFLFAPDLVKYALGDRWQPTVSLLQGLGLIVGFRQLGFNWNLFFQARGNTRPIMVSGVVALAAFVLALAPLIIAFGLDGYIAGMAVSITAELAVRVRYLRRIFPSFRPFRHTARALAPSVPAVVMVLATRALFGAAETASVAIAQFALYVLVTVVATAVFERSLVREIVGYLRGKRREVGPGGSAGDAAAAA